MSDFWSSARVLVTGGSGFLGQHVLARLRSTGCQTVFAPRSYEVDLRDARAVTRMMESLRPTLVIHLAAVVGGIGANERRPAEFYYDNLLMGTHLLHESWRAGVSKFVGIGTVCAYPKFTPTPFREDDLWSGYPEETNAPYGLAKKMLSVQGDAYRRQYGFTSIFLLPANLYGPGDNFDPASSHVIPALIRKCVEARESGAHTIDVWGDGTPTRDFLYVGDAAEAIVLASEHYTDAAPVNIGSGRDISIADLAGAIADAVGFTGAIVWDGTKPNGQPRRRLDTERAAAAFGFKASTDFARGLRDTVAWYLSHRNDRSSATALDRIP